MEARAAMAEDWVNDLAEFGADIVSGACGEWRRTQARRPTIADIRKLCEQQQAASRSGDDDARPGQKKYAEMSEAERWAWQTDVYAFRRVVLGISDDERTSPTDPQGKYFDEELVRAAVEKRRKGRDIGARRAEQTREGRAIINKWVQAKGYPDVDAYAAAIGVDWSEIYVRWAREVLPTLSPALASISVNQVERMSKERERKAS